MLRITTYNSKKTVVAVGQTKLLLLLMMNEIFLLTNMILFEPKLMLFQRKLDFSVKSKLKTPVPLKLLFLC